MNLKTKDLAEVGKNGRDCPSELEEMIGFKMRPRASSFGGWPNV
jgi:hypothetical protein